MVDMAKVAVNMAEVATVVSSAAVMILLLLIKFD